MRRFWNWTGIPFYKAKPWHKALIVVVNAAVYGTLAYQVIT
jgi:hypothetical protein